MEIIFATNNKHKTEEVKAALPHSIRIITLQEAGIDIDIPEPHQTLEDNAAEKGRTIYALTHTACFSEDTGLEVVALGGAPGVHSARYAGEEASYEKNIAKLLSELQPHANKDAQFRTVIFLLLDEKEHYFEGVCKGTIVEKPRGSAGFGYDAVFVPEGSVKTFAEMSIGEKNQYSHRKKAVDKLVAFLKQLHLNT